MGVDLASTADVAGVVGVIEGKLAGCKNNAYLRIDIINHVGWAIGEVYNLLIASFLVMITKIL